LDASPAYSNHPSINARYDTSNLITLVNLSLSVRLLILVQPRINKQYSLREKGIYKVAATYEISIEQTAKKPILE